MRFGGCARNSDRPGPSERIDVSRLVPDLGKKLHGVLAQSGRTPIRWHLDIGHANERVDLASSKMLMELRVAESGVHGLVKYARRRRISSERRQEVDGSVHGRGVISGGIGGGKARRSGSGTGVVTAAGGLGWSCSTSH